MHRGILIVAGLALLPLAACDDPDSHNVVVGELASENDRVPRAALRRVTEELADLARRAAAAAGVQPGAADHIVIANTKGR